MLRYKGERKKKRKRKQNKFDVAKHTYTHTRFYTHGSYIHTKQTVYMKGESNKRIFYSSSATDYVYFMFSISREYILHQCLFFCRAKPKNQTPTSLCQIPFSVRRREISWMFLRILRGFLAGRLLSGWRHRLGGT